ncbi:hypothetical protein ACFYZ8_10405 [Streptomyces sp. NPDC001668]|uniref:hypothetical protein n=1 Tax=Streptomyces sp. NPDC001668 TaxID=3364598 RepID=UPI0036C04669
MPDEPVPAPSPCADIRGAQGVGARSVWVSGGRPWTEPDYRPTLTTADTASAIRRLTST